MTSLDWTTRASRTAYDCGRFTVREDEVDLPDGTQTRYEYVAEPPGVVVLPFTTTGEVVYVAEWRQPVGRVDRGLPAGSLEPPEDPETAARRELAEETGYEAGSIEHLQTIEPSNGVTDAVHHHFVATDCRSTAEQNLDTAESIEIRTAEYDAFLARVLDNDIRDGRTIACLTRHALTGDGPANG